MAAAERCNLFNQLCCLFLGYKTCRLHCVDEYLQFRNAEATIFDVVAFFMTDHRSHDLESLLVEQGDVFGQCSSIAGDTKTNQPVANLCSTEGMLLICLLAQYFHEFQ